MSPASGDKKGKEGELLDIPKEVSIQLMSPASGDLPQIQKFRQMSLCFHSINVPSEWGQAPQGVYGDNVAHILVSIQLMSPASGDKLIRILR